MENESEEGSELSDLALPPNVYHPKHALVNALKDWLPEFSRQKTVWGPMSKPQVGLSQPAALVSGVNTCKTHYFFSCTSMPVTTMNDDFITIEIAVSQTVSSSSADNI